MARGISTALANMLEADSSKLVLLVKMFFEGGVIKRFNNSGVSVFWDEGSGDQEYIGVGEIASINSAEEGSDIQSYGLNFTLSGIPTTQIQDAVNLDYKNYPVYIYLAALGPGNDVLNDGDEALGPVVLFVGRMDTQDITLADTATITVDVISRLRDWERPRGGLYNHHTQKAYYAFLDSGSDLLANFDNLDRGFEYVDTLKDKEINWGGKAFSFTTSGVTTRSSGNTGQDSGNHTTDPL